MSACTAVVTLLERLNRPCLKSIHVKSEAGSSDKFNPQVKRPQTVGAVKLELKRLPFVILHLDADGMELRQALSFSLGVCYRFHLKNIRY